MRLLDDETSQLTKGDTLNSETAFNLYDTYGFPLDLTQDALKGKGIEVDVAGFDAAMAKQKEEARKIMKKHITNQEMTVISNIKEEY